MENFGTHLKTLHDTKQAEIAQEMTHIVGQATLGEVDSDKLGQLVQKHQNDFLDVYDFDNVNFNTNTYSGSQRNVISVLAKDLLDNDYLNPSEVEIDAKLMDSPNFQSFKYTRKELIEFTICKST